MNEKTKKYLKRSTVGLIILILFCSLFYLGLNGTFGVYGKLFTRPIVNSMAKLEPRICYIYSNEWSQRDSCIFDSVSRKSHIPLCEKIPRAYTVGCFDRIARATKDETVCTYVPYEYMLGCYSEVGALKKDPNVCKVFSVRPNQELNMSDTNVCYMVVIQRNNDPTLCDKVLDPAARTTCYTAIKSTGLY